MRRLTNNSTFEAYLVTNEVNGKRYVGITSLGTAIRWRSHLKSSGSARNLLSLAIRKYGKTAFRVEAIACAKSWVDLQHVERLLISQNGTFHHSGHGYNMTLGGDGAFGVIPSRETRERHSKSKMGNKYSVGAVRSPEHTAAIVAAHKGKKIPDWHKQRLRELRTGTKLSQETRLKISQIQTGREYKMTPARWETIHRAAEFNRGRGLTEEHREAIRSSLKASPKVKAHLARLRVTRFGEPRQLTLLFSQAAE